MGAPAASIWVLSVVAWPRPLPRSGAARASSSTAGGWWSVASSPGPAGWWYPRWASTPRTRLSPLASFLNTPSPPGATLNWRAGRAVAVTMGGFEDLLERTASVLSILGERPMALPPVPNLISPHVRGGDIYTVVLVTTILLMVRLAMHVSLLPALLPKTMRRSRQRKVSENVFYTAFYVSTTILGYVVYTREPWSLNLFSNESQVLPLFSPFPAPLSPLMRMYFLTELGFYVGALLFLVVDEHRKDFGIMVVHHVVSICLVVGSYLGGWVRFGAIVLALHDVGDVFLYGAKAAHNLGGCFGADTGLFVLFAVTFYVTRCVLRMCGISAWGLWWGLRGEGEVHVLVAVTWCRSCLVGEGLLQGRQCMVVSRHLEVLFRSCPGHWERRLTRVMPLAFLLAEICLDGGGLLGARAGLFACRASCTLFVLRRLATFSITYVFLCGSVLACFFCGTASPPAFICSSVLRWCDAQAGGDLLHRFLCWRLTRLSTPLAPWSMASPRLRPFPVVSSRVH